MCLCGDGDGDDDDTDVVLIHASSRCVKMCNSYYLGHVRLDLDVWY